MLYIIIIAVVFIIFFILKKGTVKKKVQPQPGATKSEVIKLKEISSSGFPEHLEVTLKDTYQDIQTITAGGMGVIAKATEIKTGKKVAIKTVLPELEQNSKAVNLFFAECEALKQMNHPNIVRVYDAGEKNDLYYYIMEFLEGENLEKKMFREKQISFADVVRIGTQISRALQHCHSNRIIHRDIKPSNIFITNKNVAKIIDFGIVKLLTGDTALKLGSTKVGTPDFASPEQLQGQPISGKSDVYSLGVCLYKMLTARMPFKGIAMVSRMFEEPRDMKQFRNNIPEELEGIIKNCLSLDPKLRYSTNELWSKLREIRIVD